MFSGIFSLLTDNNMHMSVQSFHVDFELAVIYAAQYVLPITEISGCYFHLCQAVWWKVAEVGLKTRYVQDEAFSLSIHKLMALAFVLEEDVRSAFDLMC